MLSRGGLAARAFLLLCGFCLDVRATPETVALAFPVTGITVDGDLSDWPEEMIRYPLRFQEYGDPLRGIRDFAGWFQVGYSPDEDALYVAVEVEDDAVVRGKSEEGRWDTQDGCELYLHRHRPDETEPSQYRIWGPNRGTFGPASAEEMLVEVAWHERGYCFEWRIDVAAASAGRVRLRPDLELGFDLAIWDRDPDRTASFMAWSRGVDKYRYANRLGRLVLVEPDPSVEKVLSIVGQAVTGKTSSDQERIGESVGYRMFFSGVLIAFTLLHLLLFLFDPGTRANLFYAVYTGLIAVAIFSGFQLEITLYIPFEPLAQLRKLAVLVIGAVGLGFLYSLFAPRPPRRFWFLLALLAGLVALVCLDIARPGGLLDQSLIFLLGAGLFVETLLALFNAIRQKKEGAWIIGIGFSLFALNISPLIQQAEIGITQLYWVLIPLVSMSVYLARNVARTSKSLHQQLSQVEELSQKTQEQYAQIQAQNRQIQEANQLKSDFLARMSHDLRTPMNAIIGYTRILLRKTREQLDERQYRNLENVQTSARHLLDLINDILDLSKIEAGRVDIGLDQVDLGQLAAECASAVESLVKPGVQLLQDLKEIPPVRTDPDRMRRVLTNLLSNAVKFTKEGSITVSLKQAEDGWTELAVADTGVGIPAEELPHIFDEFRQVDRRDGSRQEGTGLGLAIVRKSVEILGGTIQVESQVGRGSVFTLRIRDYEEAPPAPDESSSEKEGQEPLEGAAETTTR